MNQDTKKIIKISFVSILFLLIIIYAFFTSKNLIFGVKIKNVNIADGMKMEANVIKITGNAENASVLTLNGRVISINQKGDFEETVALAVGYNIIDINAQDKFENNDNKIYKLIYY